MPEKVFKYLDQMDQIREDGDNAVDELFSKLNIKAIMKDKKTRKQLFKFMFLKYLKDNAELFSRARKAGEDYAVR